MSGLNDRFVRKVTNCTNNLLVCSSMAVRIKAIQKLKKKKMKMKNTDKEGATPGRPFTSFFP